MENTKAIKRLKIICCIICVLCFVTFLIEDVLLINQIDDGTLTSKFTETSGAALAGTVVMIAAIMPLVFLNFDYTFLTLITAILLTVSTFKNKESGKHTLVYAIAIITTIHSILFIIVLLSFTPSLAYFTNIVCIILNAILVTLTILYRKKIKSTKTNPIQGINNV